MSENKKAPPSFQFYPHDFLVGSGDLTAEETGGYIRLLCYQWTKNGIPDNDKKLMQLSGCSAEALQSIKKKFSVVKVIDREERLFNERMDGILNKVQTFREVCRDNANKRWHGTEKVEKKKSNKDEHEQLYAELKKGEVNGAAIAKFISEVKPKIAAPYIDLWNYFAEKNNVAKLEKISDSRKRKLLTRLGEKTFDLPAILTAASKQKFALEGKWFTFDWIIGNDTNYIKVLENKYTDKPVVEAGLKA